MSQILCSCGKHIATIHVTEIIDGEKTEIHLCEECAKQKKLLLPQQHMLDLSDVLSGLIEAAGGSDAESLDAMVCPECGMTFAQFRAAGRFGCGNDYDVFRDGVDPLLERMHGTTQHRGKAPAAVSPAAKAPQAPAAGDGAARLSQLRARLEAAVAEEAYERAAELRDEIKALKKDMSDATE
jgi:protein arginine kinase activator